MEKTVVVDHGPITEMARGMEIALHETGHFVALCATALKVGLRFCTSEVLNRCRIWNCCLY